MIKKILLIPLLSLMLFAGSLSPQMVLAAPTSATNAICEGADDGSANASCDDSTSGNTVSSVIRTAIRIFQFVIGVIALFAIFVGGLGYITSGGDAGKTKTARERIMYAVIGIVIVAMAEIIVQFALNRALDP